MKDGPWLWAERDLSEATVQLVTAAERVQSILHRLEQAKDVGERIGLQAELAEASGQMERLQLA